MLQRTGNITMGAAFSAAQRSISSLGLDALSRGNVRVSKAVLKCFFHWVSFNFPQFTQQNVNSVSAWDKIGALLAAKAEQGDGTVSQFFPVFL